MSQCEVHKYLFFFRGIINYTGYIENKRGNVKTK